jgi:hypothetical protein
MNKKKKESATGKHIVKVILHGKVILEEKFFSIYNAYRRKSDLEYRYSDDNKSGLRLIRGCEIKIERDEK